MLFTPKSDEHYEYEWASHCLRSNAGALEGKKYRVGTYGEDMNSYVTIHEVLNNGGYSNIGFKVANPKASFETRSTGGVLSISAYHPYLYSLGSKAMLFYAEIRDITLMSMYNGTYSFVGWMSEAAQMFPDDYTHNPFLGVEKTLEGSLDDPEDFDETSKFRIANEVGDISPLAIIGAGLPRKDLPRRVNVTFNHRTYTDDYLTRWFERE